MIKKIRVRDLQVGMFVEDFNVPWMNHPFLSNRKKIKNAKEIQILVDNGIADVFIDTELGPDSSEAVLVGEAAEDLRKEMEREVSAPPEQPGECIPAEGLTFGEELRRAKAVYSEAKVLVRDLMRDARVGKSVDGERAARVVDEMVDSIFRNPDALTSLSRLKNFDDYTFQHSVNVAVLSLALGRHLGLVQGELKRLGIGAILHDMGKMMVPETILNKPGRLSDEEFGIMRTHTLHGAKLLMQTKDVPDDCAAVALNHHERFNGKGYPRGLQGLGIGKFGLISAIVDVYDAITSDRVYHKGMPSHQAMQKVYEWSRTDFYPIYVQKFIQCVGIYPVGSVVVLDTGETAVVCRQNRERLLRPWVRLVRGPAGQPVAPSDVDLGEFDPIGDKEYLRTIVRTADAAPLGIDVATVLG